MNSDSEVDVCQSSDRDQESNDYINHITQKKSICLRVQPDSVQLPSNYMRPSQINLGITTEKNICFLYQRNSSQVSIAGSGLIVRAFSQKQIPFSHPLNEQKKQLIIGLVLSCSHIDLNLKKDIFITTQSSIPKIDYFEIIPFFKQDYVTRTDTFKDPINQTLITANDVNLFLLLVNIEDKDKAKTLVQYLKPKIDFLDKEDIKEGLEVYLGAYSENPILTDNLYKLSPSCNLAYLNAKKELLEKPLDVDLNSLVSSFERILQLKEVFQKAKGYYRGRIKA